MNTDMYLGLSEAAKAHMPVRFDELERHCRQPPKDWQRFLSEYIWMVIKTGMSEENARLVYDRVWPLARQGHNVAHVFTHKQKASAINSVALHANTHFITYTRARDKLEFLGTLPWVGPKTKWQLAQNLGVDVVEDDNTLARIANQRNETQDEMLDRLSRDCGHRRATVAWVLLYAIEHNLLALEDEEDAQSELAGI